MSEQELTRWFTNGEKPWEPGVYEVCGSSFLGKELFSFWDGLRFNFVGSSKFNAFLFSHIAGGGDRVEGWRGLAHPPKAKP